MNTRTQIIEDLYRLGVKPGDVMLMHSSMKSLQTTETPEYVLDSIQEALGENGTLCLPALSYATVNQENPYWDYYKTPACVGLLPETFRHLPNVYRSLCPTHSVCARGKLGREITLGQEKDDTPVGINSPYRRLPALHGKILMLGCTMAPMTFMHGMEEMAKLPYVFLPEPWLYHMTDADGRQYDTYMYRHGMNRFGAQHYIRLTEVLPPEAMLRGKVLNADCYLVDTEIMQKVAQECMAKDTYFFLTLRPDAPIVK